MTTPHDPRGRLIGPSTGVAGEWGTRETNPLPSDDPPEGSTPVRHPDSGGVIGWHLDGGTLDVERFRPGLTEDERRVIALLAEAHNLFVLKVMGPDRQAAPHDLNEWAAALHVLQHMVMAQAAARAHPDLYRLLGETLEDPPFG